MLPIAPGCMNASMTFKKEVFQLLNLNCLISIGSFECLYGTYKHSKDPIEDNQIFAGLNSHPFGTGISKYTNIRVMGNLACYALNFKRSEFCKLF